MVITVLVVLTLVIVGGAVALWWFFSNDLGARPAAKSYGTALYHEMLSVLVDAWGGDSDSFLSGILHGMARFLALYQGEYSRERLVGRLRTVHPKTITRLAQNDTGNVADRHMKQILSIYNGAGRAHSLPCKR